MQILIWVMAIAFLVMMGVTQEMFWQVKHGGKHLRLFQIIYYVASMTFVGSLLVLAQIVAAIGSKTGVIVIP